MSLILPQCLLQKISITLHNYTKPQYPSLFTFQNTPEDSAVSNDLLNLNNGLVDIEKVRSEPCCGEHMVTRENKIDNRLNVL